MIFNTKFITPKILLVSQSSDTPIARAFMRLQSFYDSIELKNKIFSTADVNLVYPNYENVFRGFNISDKVIEPFKRGLFNPLTQEEISIIALTKNIAVPYYIIGVNSSDSNLLMHELHHAFYYLYPEYKKSVDSIMNNHYSEINSDTLIKLYNLFSRFKYSLDIYSEEVSAYILADNHNLQRNGIWDDTFEKYHNLLLDNYIKFKNKAGIIY